MNHIRTTKLSVIRAYSLISGRLRNDYLRNRLSRAKKVLATPYRHMVFQDGLNFQKTKFRSPPLQILHEDPEWLVLQIADYTFVWPAEYRLLQGLEDLYHETLAPAQYNPHAYESANIRIRPGDWVVDGGACEGFFTHHALKCGAKVLAIEPIPKLAEALRLTFEDKIREGRVHVIEGALTSSPGPLRLTIPANEVYSASVDTSGAQVINGYSLDAILYRDKVVPTIDFVKLDVEGAEIDAINGAMELLHLVRPMLSIAVYHDYLNAVLLRKMIWAAHSGYRVSWRGLFIREEFGAPRPVMLHAYSV